MHAIASGYARDSVGLLGIVVLFNNNWRSEYNMLTSPGL